MILIALWLVVRLAVAPAVIHAFLAAPTADNPTGGLIWSNLVASLVCVAAAWWRLRAQAVRHHVQALAQQAHQHRQRLEQADQHHENLKQHVADTVNGHLEQAVASRQLQDPSGTEQR